MDHLRDTRQWVRAIRQLIGAGNRKVARNGSVDHIAKVDDADGARRLRAVNEQVVRVEIVMHHLRAQ